jgi:hypothetical protein
MRCSSDARLNDQRPVRVDYSSNRVLKNKNQAVRQGARRYDKRGIFKHMWALARVAQRGMAASDAVF